MNMKYNFDRRLVLTISVLLTALWLPLTTFAQNFPEASDFPLGAISWVDNCKHCQVISDSQDLRNCQQSHDALTFSADSDSRAHEESAGFTETDPAIQPSRDVMTFLQTPDYRKQQVFVGFSETDPTERQFLDTVATLSSSNILAQQVIAGFDETDPADNIRQSDEEIYKRIFVSCSGRNAKVMVPG